MNTKTKFYLYFLITIILSPLLLYELVMVFQLFNEVDMAFVLLILLVYLGLYLSIRKDFLLPFNDLQQWVYEYNIDQSARLSDTQKTNFQPVAVAINDFIA
jgi:two-component system nitrate/nitrite sensor histidine kinase NarX